MHDSTPVLTRAPAAGQSLHDALSAPRTRKAQAAALRGVRGTARAPRRRSSRSSTRQPVVAPSQHTQVQTYRLIAARARALATALRAGKSGAQEVHDLQLAVATRSSTQAQRARIVAIEAFNRRTAMLRRLKRTPSETQPPRTNARLIRRTYVPPGTSPRARPSRDADG